VVQRLAERGTDVPLSLGTATGEIQVPRPDLERFDELLKDTGEADGE
jgi:hypothetical protein